MELAEVLRRRRMVRAYDPDARSPTTALAAVLAAARSRAVGRIHPGRLVPGADRGRRTGRRSGRRPPTGDRAWLRGMRTAPVLMLVWTSQEAYLDRYAEPDKGWTDRDPARWSAPYWYVDAGMAAWRRC